MLLHTYVVSVFRLLCTTVFESFKWKNTIQKHLMLKDMLQYFWLEFICEASAKEKTVLTMKLSLILAILAPLFVSVLTQSDGFTEEEIS